MIYKFNPKSDITSFELAKIIAIMNPDYLDFGSEASINNKRLLRHFNCFKDNKELVKETSGKLQECSGYKKEKTKLR
jgi:hypothetical protein